MLNWSDFLGLYILGRSLKDERYYCPSCGLEVTPHQTKCFHCNSQFTSGAEASARRREETWLGFWILCGIIAGIVAVIILIIMSVSYCNERQQRMSFRQQDLEQYAYHEVTKSEWQYSMLLTYDENVNILNQVLKKKRQEWQREKDYEEWQKMHDYVGELLKKHLKATEDLQNIAGVSAVRKDR